MRVRDQCECEREGGSESESERQSEGESATWVERVGFSVRVRGDSERGE